MDNRDREQRIRERAHQFWIEEGSPHGRDQEHWDRAAREVEEQEKGGANPAEAPPVGT